MFFTIVFVIVVTIAVSQVIAVDPQGNTLCDPPTVTPVHFGDYVQIIVGSDHTFSCVIQSNTPLCEGFPKWGRRHSEPLPNHLINNGSCPTLPNATCSNLTLLNVSQSDGSGYYTITAENECGSDNFTVNVEKKSKLTCNHHRVYVYACVWPCSPIWLLPSTWPVIINCVRQALFCKWKASSPSLYAKLLLVGIVVSLSNNINWGSGELDRCVPRKHIASIFCVT